MYAAVFYLPELGRHPADPAVRRRSDHGGYLRRPAERRRLAPRPAPPDATGLPGPRSAEDDGPARPDGAPAPAPPGDAAPQQPGRHARRDQQEARRDRADRA